MRTVTTKVFKFDELPAEVQDLAVDKIRSKVAEILIDFDADDYRDALAALQENLSIRVRDWSVDSYSYYYNFTFTGDRWDDLADDARYLCRYLDDLYFSLRKGKYYSTTGSWIDGKYHYKERRSRALIEPWCGCLTGCWTDHAMADAMENRYEAVRAGKTIRDFVGDILENFFIQWRRDIESAYTDEAVRDHIEANDLEFTEDGEQY